MNDHLLQKLEAITFVGRTGGNGITPISCILHDDETPSAWVGDTHWGCHSCGVQEPLKALAVRLGTSHVMSPEEQLLAEEKRKQRHHQKHKDAEKYRKAIQALYGHKSCTLDAHGQWYFDTHRSTSSTFAQRYGFRSRGPGLWPSGPKQYPWTTFGLPAHLKRWGILVIPYWTVTRETTPTMVRFRAALPGSETSCPPSIRKKLWPRPDRYFSPRNAPTYLFNERTLHEGHKDVAVTEGELDAIALVEAGMPAVALPGKSIGWRRLADLALNVSPVPRLILVPDNEPAAIETFKQRAREHLSKVRWEIHVPKHKDVDETRKREGGLAWE